MICMTCARSKKRLRSVIIEAASEEFCTAPTTGAFLALLTMLFMTLISSIASAREMSFCGTCMFISSPSASAL